MPHAWLCGYYFTIHTCVAGNTRVAEFVCSHPAHKSFIFITLNCRFDFCLNAPAPPRPRMLVRNELDTPHACDCGGAAVAVLVVVPRCVSRRYCGGAVVTVRLPVSRLRVSVLLFMSKHITQRATRWSSLARP